MLSQRHLRRIHYAQLSCANSAIGLRTNFVPLIPRHYGIGKNVRILIKSFPVNRSDPFMRCAEFTHAEVSLDTYGSIHLQLLKIEELSRNPGKTSDQEELPVDCVSWYELVGAGVLNQVITDLNARGYDSLCISEKGEILLQTRIPQSSRSISRTSRQKALGRTGVNISRE